MTDPSKRKYLPWDAPGVTSPPPNEVEDTEAVIKMFQGLIGRDYDRHGRAYPTTHARTLGIVKGKLIVSKDLPPHLKQGLFAHAKEYPVVMRYSTQTHDVGFDDRTTSFRATSIKIFNVHGDRLPDGLGLATQDFNFNSSSSELDLSDAKTAREIIGLRMRGVVDPAGMMAALQARPDAELQLRNQYAPMTPAETLEYYSQTPYRFGKYVGKHGLFPVGGEDWKKRGDVKIDGQEQDTRVLGRWLKEWYGENGREQIYEWRWQLCEDLKEQPVEFAGTKWDPVKYPYQTVAKLVFPKQDPLNNELKTFWEDNMRIAPWRGLACFQPMGSSNRVRRVAYAKMRAMREQMNGRKVVEVRKIEDLPGPIPEGIPKEGLLERLLGF